ncbi:MAG: hypothetical protein NVSMB2_04920 [Chloroflexota bacterium]
MSGVVDLERVLSLMRAAAMNADVHLRTAVGVHTEVTLVRLWRGQVLVDWEADEDAGGCLVRPDLVERLVALHATVRADRADHLKIVASGRIVSALTPEHAALVTHLGGARRVELELALATADDRYAGGTETYALVERGRRAPLIRIVAQVQQRAAAADAGSPHTLRETL